MKKSTRKQLIGHIKDLSNFLIYHRKKDWRIMKTDHLTFGIQFGFGVLLLILTFFDKIFALFSMVVFFTIALSSGIKLIHYFPYVGKELDKLGKANE